MSTNSRETRDSQEADRHALDCFCLKCSNSNETHNEKCLCEKCAPAIERKPTVDTKQWDRFENILDGFFNDVIEAELRYIKGKSYGEEPRDYFKKQLGHWEENFKSYINLIKKDLVIDMYKDSEYWVMKAWLMNYAKQKGIIDTVGELEET